jgi:hypothetical protein
MAGTSPAMTVEKPGSPLMRGRTEGKYDAPSPFIPANAGIQRKGLRQKSTKPGSPLARGRTEVKDEDYLNSGACGFSASSSS